MKRILVILSLIMATGCKETPKSIDESTQKPEKVEAKTSISYPENVRSVFEAHGGLPNWKDKATLSYNMPKPDGAEMQTIDVNNRNEKIETPDYTMGYDGKDYWLVDENDIYEGDPVFYHNLMFYFYAMPFVLADDGIIYSDTEDLEFDGTSYPGIRISYDDGVGVSPKDEYFLHYDTDTKQMAWLGYTVTYRSGEKSDNIKWIRYDDWQEVGGLLLPKSLTWYKVENGRPTEANSTRKFEDVSLTEMAKPSDFYGAPDNAEIVTKE
ncbi:hypothetical protein FGM00_10505 [Aggregatimonas sangjinii]|uniref:Threonine synthase n=1 Tax=Aggregatimonas sangjinii TaxID=2583587 RepID=A0A5B7SV69_9FLAO|nr:DUF6503 family protein [Aggregatimonas sangjinii]QCX00524.1 hypothetical protein FGM00_10505 [Aggregatimonas sangjinii]